MKVKQFFDLPQEEQDKVVQIYTYRKGIQHRRRTLEEEYREYHTAITALRNSCDHVAVIKKARSDTGNWSASDDSYWYDCSCPDCGKTWKEDQ